MIIASGLSVWWNNHGLRNELCRMLRHALIRYPVARGAGDVDMKRCHVCNIQGAG
jgi:hypothetical protein